MRELWATPRPVFCHCLSGRPLPNGREGGLAPCWVVKPWLRPQNDRAAGSRTWVYLCSLTCPDQRGAPFLCVSPAPRWWHCTPEDQGDTWGTQGSESSFRQPRIQVLLFPETQKNSPQESRW